jgi:thiol-disulfide isomerase/thioredoxin
MQCAYLGYHRSDILEDESLRSFLTMTNTSSPNPSPNPSPKTSPKTSPNSTKLRNALVAIVAIVLSTLVALGVRSPGAKGAMDMMAKSAVPYEQAVSNGKPSLVEFYANWCSACKAMAPELVALKQTYGKEVNFVMLNVDNDKWLPEVTHYKVDGIPHFLYLDQKADVQAQAIGKQPSNIVSENLQALINHTDLPHKQASAGQTTQYQPPAATQTDTNDDPRSHGAQVNAG